MSWLARSIVNSLRGEEDEDSPQSKSNEGSPSKSLVNRENERQAEEEEQEEEDDDDPTRGVKEDLSELTKTLTRQLWGVASFLAPPPSAGGPPTEDRGQRSEAASPDDAEGVDSPRLAGIRSDLSEIGGRFRTGISLLSSTKAVSEISKIASTFLPFGSEEDEEGESEEVEGEYGGGAVGVTDEVIAFARNISMHPETWLDFPLIPDEEDSDEFDMSDAQQEHALAVERLAPRLAALRIELSPSHMSEGRFWKIYFVLLHSRLNSSDAELLTTPQIVQARAMLLQDLQTRAKPTTSVSPSSSNDTPVPNEADALVPVEQNVIPSSEAPVEKSSSKTVAIDETSTLVPITEVVPITELETEKHPVETTEVKIIDKSVIEEDPPVTNKITDISSDVPNEVSIHKYEEDADDWLEEEDTAEASGSKDTTVPLGNDEEVSFSDLEDDDDDDRASKSLKAGSSAGVSRPKDSKEDWIQLKSSEGTAKGGNAASSENKESGDWLSIDDLDDV